MEGQWDIVISSLQDIFNSNEELNFDEDKDILNTNVSDLNEKQLNEVLQNLTNHKENVDKSRRVLETILDNLSTVIATENKRKANDPKFKKGRSFWTSPFNESDSITMGGEVAFRLRQRGAEDEWIQCEVTKVIGDGTKFEVRDPEPDENNNPGKTYKATWKDVIMIPSTQSVESLVSYPYGTKVLARYPETTTFYPAEVIGTKRDGRCRLRFEGEEEEGKETEVDRRLVIPFPSK
ncbi:SAGA-associated factor 29 [Wickerhamomyces ciferrii]|uniref:SAGA-associated factor 29 n=1 Tax=Wickerhamomyces ciferrii (strain ATCC 14091 / BCRC 22168 / CBS 111 / JCM 3599 / NBRC 0793 / NRRL Y-1031 F-60-10) TaxID=1206466 RepID=K0KCK0_WICCF|nr:SAGA-associated factor 29 [Wickerhamomyces ciferrii]CCH42785.1 SAGA-associated factor 29 [Wickerhamomyces ciferrii]